MLIVNQISAFNLDAVCYEPIIAVVKIRLLFEPLIPTTQLIFSENCCDIERGRHLPLIIK